MLSTKSTPMASLRLGSRVGCAGGVAVALLVGAGSGSAQTPTATLCGTVRDELGGVLAGVSVEVRHVATNLERATTTAEAGQFCLPLLPTGSYEATVSLSQFSSEKRTGIALAVGEEATIEVTLRLASLASEVSVVTETPVLEITSNTVGRVVSQAELDDLPVFERDFTDLAVLTPGVVPAGRFSGIVVNGQKAFENGFFIDGVSAERQSNGEVPGSFPQDWVGEYRVMTNSYPAEFGTASGGILNVVTRSGTNDWHGRAYTFVQDDGLNAKPFAGRFDEGGEPVYLDEVPPYRQWRLGGFLGGPIIRDRLFLFAGYERLDRDGSAVLGISDYWRGRGVESVLPTARTGNPFLLKLDAALGAGNRLALRFDRSDTGETNVGEPLDTEENRVRQGGSVWNAVATWTSALSPRSFNELRVSFKSIRQPEICNKSGTYGRAHSSERPGTYSTWIYPGARFGCPLFNGLVAEENFNLSESLSFAAGRHQLKGGIQAHLVRMIGDGNNFHDGLWFFGEDRAFDLDDPASYPLAFVANIGRIDFGSSAWSLAAFLQDTWRLTDRLTLNLGLRYDWDGTVRTGNEFVDAKNASIVARYGGDPPFEKTRADTNNLAPRIGLAYALGEKKRTVLTAGAGLFYDQSHNNLNGIQIVNTLLSEEFVAFDAMNPFANPFGSPEAMRRFLAEAFPYFPDRSLAPRLPPIIDLIDAGLRVPRTVQITAGVAQDLGHGLSVEASYAFAKGEDKLLSVHRNIALVDGQYVTRDPRFGWVGVFTNAGWSRYHALLLKAGLRTGRVQAGLAYTLSRSRSNTGTQVTGGSATNPLDLSEDIGPDEGDRRHNLVLDAVVHLPLGFSLAGLFTYRSALPYSAWTLRQLDEDPFSDWPEPRNSRRGDDESTTDVRVAKEFKLGHGLRLSLFWEIYNLFNRDNFVDFEGNIDTPNFGRPLAALDRRRQQGGLRLEF